MTKSYTNWKGRRKAIFISDDVIMYMENSNNSTIKMIEISKAREYQVSLFKKK